AYIERVRRLAEQFDHYTATTGRLADPRSQSSDLKSEILDLRAQQSASGSSPAGISAITPERPLAYFCAEYGVHNSLPLYSGGLGVLAGDHLKSASDLGLPLVAVGLLYHY